MSSFGLSRTGDLQHEFASDKSAAIMSFIMSNLKGRFAVTCVTCVIRARKNSGFSVSKSRYGAMNKAVGEGVGSLTVASERTLKKKLATLFTDTRKEASFFSLPAGCSC